MLYLGLAGIYLPLTLHSQTKLLYRAPNASQHLSYGPTTLFGTIIQDDLDSFRLTSKHSHTTHCYTCHNKVVRTISTASPHKWVRPLTQDVSSVESTQSTTFQVLTRPEPMLT
jgi:hypothetical protein